MSQEVETVTRAELEEVIIKQANSNPKYRELLLSNPKELLERQIGQKLPEGMTVEVVQETANKVFIRLPHVVQEGDELKDEDLEQVAGGKSESKDTVTCATATAGGFATKNEIHAM
jgi:hypothetical protein